MNKKIKDDAWLKQFHVYSTRTAILIGLQNALGVYNNILPEPSSAFLIELRKKQGEYIVTVSIFGRFMSCLSHSKFSNSKRLFWLAFVLSELQRAIGLLMYSHFPNFVCKKSYFFPTYVLDCSAIFCWRDFWHRFPLMLNFQLKRAMLWILSLFFPIFNALPNQFSASLSFHFSFFFFFII